MAEAGSGIHPKPVLGLDLQVSRMIRASDFDYVLPPELVARHPSARRDASRLLVMSRDGDTPIRHRHFHDLPEFLRRGDLLVINDTRVIPARLMARRSGTGGAVEIFLIEEKEPGLWLAMVRPGRKIMTGERLVIAPREFEAEVISFAGQGERIIRFHTSLEFSEALRRYGHTPLPPYILKARKEAHEDSDVLDSEQDRERYQTIYAREGASVAAPTAGLHFTEELLRQCKEAGVGLARVELDVGAGTFLPVKTEDVSAHPMHFERYKIGEEAVTLIQSTREHGGRVIAVGTTVVRVLETVATHPEGLRACEGSTDLFILPGFPFRMVDGLITNFHLPRSTLLMLVSAFAGRENVLAAYDEAVREQYRFYSYGDAMLIL